jgi:hypothetical protein
MVVFKKAVKEWLISDCTKHWDSLSELKKVKALLQEPYTNKTGELLKLNRNQLQLVVGLLTGHCHLKGLLFKLGLTNNPRCL